MSPPRLVNHSCFRPSRLALFWRFVCERQNIWHKRFVQRLQPPWTEDPILQNNRFTNVYRELDPGTRYAIEAILEVMAPRPDKLFNIMFYRLIGRAESHAYVGFQLLKTFDPLSLEARLKTIRDVHGKAPFTAAYMVSSYTSMGSSDKIHNIVSLFANISQIFDSFFDRLVGCTCPEDVHAVLSSLYGFGNFLSYQILVDLLYPLQVYGGAAFLPFSQDDWASAGPGARRGISELLRTNVKQGDLRVMRWLRQNQREEFGRLGLTFPYLIDGKGDNVDISLANIQNCLCEFHKYLKIAAGTGKARRRFSAG